MSNAHVCLRMCVEGLLKFNKVKGNDLSTPHP